MPMTSAAPAPRLDEVAATSSPLDGKRVALLCFTYGEPPTTRFGEQFFYSWSILNRLTRMVAPIPKAVTPLIALYRGRIRKRLWTEEGYSSPLEAITIRQVAAIREAVTSARPGVKWDVRAVYEFRRPFLPEILAEFAKNPPDKILVLPLYVAESDYTHNISRNDFAAYRSKAKSAGRWLPDPAYALRFGYDEAMADAFADFALRYCAERGWDDAKMAGAAFVMGAHGTLAFPKVGVESGRKETSYFFGLARERLKSRFKTIRLGWLNHKFGGEWTSPDVETLAKELWEKGIRRLVYFPFGFFADNAESQLEGKMILRNHAWEEYLHLPCPNDDPAVMRRLAAMALDVAEGRVAAPSFEAKNLR
jgi:ferrochelatase